MATAMVGPLSFVEPDVAFDHPCASDRIRVIRSQGTTVDLDVCGLVRRYKAFASGFGGSTWLDVTNSYPASSLPKPLPSE